MKKNKTGLYFALMAVAVLSLSVMVSSYRGNFEEKSPYYEEERCEEMLDAFNELDYEAWRELMTMNSRHSKVLDVINEENFYLFVEAHRAGKNGEYEIANAIRSELGLNNGVGLKNGEGFGKMNGLGKMTQKGQGAGEIQLHKNR
jgi:hypothetical protein